MSDLIYCVDTKKYFEGNNRRPVGVEIRFDQLGQESKPPVLGMKAWSGKTAGTQVGTDHLGICRQLNGYDDQGQKIW